MKKIALFASLVLILFSYSTAFGEWVTITLESYAPATLPEVSTIEEVADPTDQLAMSRIAAEFALSEMGWDLAAYGCNLGYREPPVWDGHIYWIHCEVDETGSDLSNLLGYDVLKFFLPFHTDEEQGRLSHDTCETLDNYGVISGAMGAAWIQCVVPQWGTFTVETVPPPPSLEARVEALEEKVMTLESQVGAMMDDYIELQDRLMQLEQDLQDHSHDYLTGKGTGHNNSLATTGPPTQGAPAPVPAGK